MKKLQEILVNIVVIQTQNAGQEVNIAHLAMDSRFVRKGSLFVATKGTTTDGHAYIQQAVEKGAVAIVCEVLPEILEANIAYIQVGNSAIALGQIAANFYGNPSAKMQVIGITGTNGKTSIANLLHQLFSQLGFPCGLLSTIEVIVGVQTLPATHTTPDAIAIQESMKKMVENGCVYCFMEVSSHAIDQHRIEGIQFRGGIFTNITHDHLDYHKTFRHYLDTKKAFFDALPKTAVALTNLDDKNGSFMLQNCAAKHTSYALHAMADYRCSIVDVYAEGMSLKIENTEIYTQLKGEFNAYNLLAVYGMAVELGMEKRAVDIALSKLKPVRGRFQTVRSHFQNITGIIDYAHTPDALEKLLVEGSKLKKDRKMLVVMGCGGNRDKEKRPIMGSIAGRYADKLILTSDNPRDEDPVEIIREIKGGLDGEMLKKTLTVIDRIEAICTAAMLAEEGDLIVVAGKGHETYQEIKGQHYEMDDMKILVEAMDELKL